MNIIYNKSLLPKFEATQASLKDIKCIMIQSTGIENETAATFYDNIAMQSVKKYAHFVIDGTSVVQYNYLNSSVFVEDITFTEKAMQLLAGESPALQTIVIEICHSTTNYNLIELNAIKFITQFLKIHNLTTDNVWRRGDVITDIVYDTVMNNNPQYSEKENWDSFISNIKLALEELNKESPNLDSVSYKYATYSYPLPPFVVDDRPITALSSKIDIATLADEDYDITSQGDIYTKKDKFTGQVTSTGGTTVFEPIYPDLTVPPRSITKLYNEPVKDIRKMSSKTKPILGKPVNNQDPYPVDDKIIELESHYPVVNLDDAVLNEIRNSTDSMAAYLVSLSQRSEKRIVQLENTLSTMMRYMFRLGARMNINCVYYGGQSSYGKYNCIRCLSDDLVNDGGIVSIDQCLNCSRYEPIIGQVYDILNDDMKLDLAPILDDIQAARTTMDDYIKLTRIEEIVDEEEDAICDIDNLTNKDSDDRFLNELAQENESFIMNWTETELPQTPDINEYEYDNKKIFSDKKQRIKPTKKYVDGYNGVAKKKINPSVNSYSFGSSGGNGGSASFSENFTIDNYDWTNAPVRKAIVDTAIEFAAMGKQAKAKYVFGGKIKDAYHQNTLAEIYTKIINGETICSKYGDADTPIYKDAISIDCSGFARYCYKHNGINIVDGSQNQFNDLTLVGPVGDYKLNIAKAAPGDLIFYGSSKNEINHVTVYIGGEEQCEAATAKAAIDNQVRRSKVRTTNFIGIGRLNSIDNGNLPKVIGDELVMTACKIIFANEGSYDSINKDDNGSMSLGKIQWHGVRAYDLLKLIREENMSQFNSLLQNTSIINDMDNRMKWDTKKVITDADYNGLKALLKTAESKKAQDKLAIKDVGGYINNGRALGITDYRVLVYYADLENLGGENGPKRVIKNNFSNINAADITLEAFHIAAGKDGPYGKAVYTSRRETTYNKCLNLIL